MRPDIIYVADCLDVCPDVAAFRLSSYVWEEWPFADEAKPSLHTRRMQHLDRAKRNFRSFLDTQRPDDNEKIVVPINRLIKYWQFAPVGQIIYSVGIRFQKFDQFPRLSCPNGNRCCRSCNDTSCNSQF